jgi:SAM-dependent methyltransferase
MDPRYEEDTLSVEEAHWWYRGRRRIVREAVAALDLARPADILDAGCGSGRNLVELAPFGRLTGLEPSSASAEVARSRGLGTIVESGIERMPFEPESFDLVVSLDVIEHVGDHVAALRELRRVTRPGGRLLVTVPAYQALWSSHDVRNHHQRRYNRRTLVEPATAAGWSVVRTTHFNSLLLPAAAAARMVDRVARRDGNGRSELDRTTGPLNRLLEQPLRLEAALLRSGRRLPAGLSLMAVFAANGRA